MPLIWITQDGVVNRIHYNPAQLDERERVGSITVESIPDRPETDADVRLLYDEQDGLYYGN